MKALRNIGDWLAILAIGGFLLLFAPILNNGYFSGEPDEHADPENFGV